MALNRRQRRDQLRSRQLRQNAKTQRQESGERAFPVMATGLDRDTPLPLYVEAPPKPELPVVRLPDPDEEQPPDKPADWFGTRDFDPPTVLGYTRPERAPTPAPWSCRYCGGHSWWELDEWGSRRYCNNTRCMGAGPRFEPTAEGFIGP